MDKASLPQGLAEVVFHKQYGDQRDHRYHSYWYPDWQSCQDRNVA